MKYDIRKLLVARMKKGWNQTALAFRAGLSVATVSYVESGKRSTPKAVKAMADALGLNIEDLVLEDTVYAQGSTSRKPSKRRKAS